MKTLSHVLTVLVCCWATLASAQCGVQAYFTDTVNPNNTTVFHNGSTVTNGTITSYQWSFGDGSSSTAANPDHHYSQPGNYTVCLSVTAQVTNAPGTTCMDSFCKTVSVACASGLQINTTHTSGNNYASYTVTPTGGTGPYAYQWSNGSTSASTTVQYSAAGNYYLCVTVTDASGCAISECETATVTSIYSCNGAQANFTQTITTNTVAVQSTSSNTNSNTLYQWYLDGLPYTNPTPNTGYTFNGLPVGNHTICLYVYAGSNNYLCDTVCHTFFVPGTGPCGGAVADFNYSFMNNGILVNAGAEHYPTGTQFQWSVDGVPTTPSANDAQRFFENLGQGAHQVCLYIYTDGGAFCDSACQTVTVSGCNVTLNPNFSFGATNSGVTFTGFSNPQGTIYHWVFGDGTTQNTTTANTTHQYPVDTNTHVYTACLITYLSGTACVDSSCQQVTVPAANVGCQAGFSWTVNPNGVFMFTNTSQGAPPSWLWDFGDGAGSTSANPNH